MKLLPVLCSQHLYCLLFYYRFVIIITDFLEHKPASSVSSFCFFSVDIKLLLLHVTLNSLTSTRLSSSTFFTLTIRLVIFIVEKKTHTFISTTMSRCVERDLIKLNKLIHIELKCLFCFFFSFCFAIVSLSHPASQCCVHWYHHSQQEQHQW